MNKAFMIRALFLPIILLFCFSIYSETIAQHIDDAVANHARSEQDKNRDKTSKPAEVLKFFGVKQDMRVADLFSGGGYYSEILSYAVGPEGKVIAHNNKAYAEYSGDETKKRYAENRLGNVVQLQSEANDMGLGNANIDMVLMVMAYHDIYLKDVTDFDWPDVNRELFFEQIKNALKPGGILAVVDHAGRKGTGNSEVKTLHRIEEDFAKQDIENIGFRLVGELDVLRNPDDDRTKLVFDESVRRKTDRFVYRFIKK